MKKGITEAFQISIITLLIAIGIAMPKISTIPIGDDLNFAFWSMLVGVIISVIMGISLFIQTFEEKRPTVRNV
ncbi:MAG: hypothetical protein O8C58_00055 [Candidatus Methanoperedens sp.]|nr:hypothetical protein [Candidatus Methanoperedens sp.]